MNTMLVTGSSGLIGSEVSSFFSREGWSVHGVDNNARAQFFGPEGDTNWTLQRLVRDLSNFRHHDVDIRDREAVLAIVKHIKPSAVVHAAAQPSHDLAARIPFDDFDTNAVGTLNMLEATRQFAPDAVFVHMSTNKVYGDAPNQIPHRELPTRWDYASESDFDGVAEDLSIDQCKHSLFGASKVAADVMVQEYGRYYGMLTCCLRCGCLTGPNHSGVQLHGFLSYLIRCNLLRKKYTIFGYKGKQVRDNVHSLDVAQFIKCYLQSPRRGEVYNLGGGRENSCSILEAFEMIESISGHPMIHELEDRPREGDHVCYISNLSKIRSHFPDWRISRSLLDIMNEIHSSWIERMDV